MTKNYSLPAQSLLQQQTDWLAPLRARILRRIAIAHRKRVLDFGAGFGALTNELSRRCGGKVVALDVSFQALQTALRMPLAQEDMMEKDEDVINEEHPNTTYVCANGVSIPFPDSYFDLVVGQWVLFWIPNLQTALAEIWRVLEPGGVFVSFEPDYDGMIEYPPSIASRDIWMAALSRAGADPMAGRKLPSLLTAQGFDIRVDMLPEMHPPSPVRFDFLYNLPLTYKEQAKLKRIQKKEAALHTTWGSVAHLPLFVVTATKPHLA